MSRLFRAWGLCLLFCPSIIFASENNKTNNKFWNFKSYLAAQSAEIGEVRRGEDNAFHILLNKSTRFFVTDLEYAKRHNIEVAPVLGRDEEIKTVMSVMTRPKGRVPVLLGPSGVGKTAIVQGLAESILEKSFPQTGVYNDIFENAEIIETTPALLSSLAKSDDPAAQAMAVELYFRAVQEVERAYEKKTGQKKKIIVFIDEVHTLSDPQVEALKTLQEDLSQPIITIEASTSAEFELRFKYNIIRLLKDDDLLWELESLRLKKLLKS